jgi:heme exporter protein B
VTTIHGAVAIAGKDLRIEVRGRYALGAVLPFAATLLITFGLSLGPGRRVLSFRRAYEAESEDGALEGLALAPIDRASIFLGKAAAVAVQLWALEAAIVLLVAVLFGLPFGGSPLVLLGAFALGTVGLAAVGSLFGVLESSPSAREAVFPLLVLPLAVPVLLGGVKATALATTGHGADAGSWLLLLLAFDAVFLSAGTLVFGFLLDD